MHTAVEDLRKRIEQMYGSKVEIKDFFSDDPGSFGWCDVTDQGIPVIQWNLPNNLIDETIAHELFHLELRVEGFPVFVLPLPEGMHLDLLKSIRSRLYGLNDPILHVHIFKRMKAIGLDPHAYVRKGLAGVMEQGLLGPETDPLDRCLIFMRSELECDDPGLRAKITALFEKEDWQADMEKGRQLAHLIGTAEVDTPVKTADVLTAAANLLYAGSFTFFISEWREKKKGSHTEQQVVYKLNVSPA